VRPDAPSPCPAETGYVSQIEPQTCSLRLAAEGVVERCPRESCVYWEPDLGGVGGCFVHNLGVDTGRPELAAYLLELRERLEAARDLAEADAARRNFARRLGKDV
jgi:hypothetical protein